jgi:hypothetical protein
MAPHSREMPLNFQPRIFSNFVLDNQIRPGMGLPMKQNYSHSPGRKIIGANAEIPPPITSLPGEALSLNGVGALRQAQGLEPISLHSA